jgi:methionyl-tRNA formyltransferase
VFFGSGEFSRPALAALLDGPDGVELAVSMPPRPAGRGRRMTPSPLAVFARACGVEVLETARPDDPEPLGAIRSAGPDLLVVAAYGALLKKSLLTLCGIPPLNVHPSLLPRHRGPAPVQWAVVNGDAETGVSIMLLDEGMDTGPLLLQTRRAVAPFTGAEGLMGELAAEGADLLMEAISGMKAGTLGGPTPQDGSKATVNRLLVKSDGRLDFRRPALELANLINGLEPWPGAQALLEGSPVRLFSARASGSKAEPGEVLGLSPEGWLEIGAADGCVLVGALQLPGKRRLPAGEFLRGARPARFSSDWGA